MKAIRVHAFGGPEALKLEEVPDPSPGAGQIVVRVKAIGVNPVETYIRAGIYGPKTFPFTPGTDAAGEIEAVGPNVGRWRPGDRIYTSSTLTGAYAEKILCDPKTVHPLPMNVSFAQGAAIGVPYATAYRALFVRGDSKAGEVVLIHGASGGAGIAAVQLARAAGLTIIGTAGTDKGLALVKQQGAQHVVNHHSAEHFDEIMKLTGGIGVPIIIEFAAHQNLGKDLTVLAKKGRVIVVGNRGPVQINARDTMSRDADIRGMSLMNATAPELSGIHAALGAGLENGTLRPVIGTEFPLADASKAHEAIINDRAFGKIVLLP